MSAPERPGATTPPLGHAELRRRITAWSIEWGPVPHHGIMQAFALLADCAAALDEVATLREKARELRAELESAADRESARIAEVHEQQRLGQDVATLRAELEKFRLEHANVEFLCKQALRKVNDQDAELVALLAERDRLRAALESLVALYGPETDYHHVIEPYAWAEIIALISEETTNG